MRISALLMSAGTALLISGCSTTQQNPIYQQSTVYKSSDPYAGNSQNVRQADYRTHPQSAQAAQTQAPAPVVYAAQQAGYTRVNKECLSRETDRKILGTVAGGAVGALAGRTIAGDNKTLGTIAGAAIGGAAGYGIADKTIDCDPIYVPASQQTATITPAYQPEAIAYPADYSTQASIQETTQSQGDQGTPGFYAVNGGREVEPVTTPAAQTLSITPSIGDNLRHRVQEGDTVYSLARQSCISVAALKQLNGINDEFYIRAGDDIIIPASQCIQ